MSKQYKSIKMSVSATCHLLLVHFTLPMRGERWKLTGDQPLTAFWAFNLNWAFPNVSSAWLGWNELVQVMKHHRQQGKDKVRIWMTKLTFTSPFFFPLSSFLSTLSTVGPHIGRYCGHTSPGRVISYTGILSMTITTDNAIAKEGFSANYTVRERSLPSGHEDESEQGEEGRNGEMWGGWDVINEAKTFSWRFLPPLFDNISVEI